MVWKNPEWENHSFFDCISFFLPVYFNQKNCIEIVLDESSIVSSYDFYAASNYLFHTKFRLSPIIGDRKQDDSSPKSLLTNGRKTTTGMGKDDAWRDSP